MCFYNDFAIELSTPSSSRDFDRKRKEIKEEERDLRERKETERIERRGSYQGGVIEEEEGEGWMMKGRCDLDRRRTRRQRKIHLS